MKVLFSGAFTLVLVFSNSVLASQVNKVVVPIQPMDGEPMDHDLTDGITDNTPRSSDCGVETKKLVGNILPYHSDEVQEVLRINNKELKTTILKVYLNNGTMKCLETRLSKIYFNNGFEVPSN